MRNTFILLSLLALQSISAHGQVVLNSATASLSSVSTTTVTSVGGGTGTLKSIACAVGNIGVSGFVTADLRVTLDGVHTTTYSVYPGGNGWSIIVGPLEVHVANPAASGPNSGDSFIIPMNVDYTSGLTVDVHVTGAGSAGNLICSVLHT